MCPPCPPGRYAYGYSSKNYTTIYSPFHKPKPEENIGRADKFLPIMTDELARPTKHTDIKLRHFQNVAHISSYISSILMHVRRSSVNYLSKF